MQRYFLETGFNLEGEAVLFGEDYKHIVQVMRMAIDGKIIVVAEAEAFIATIKDITDDKVIVKKEGEPLPENELPVHITIACGLAKGDKHDLIVQKGTELGVSEVILFKAERSIVKWDDKKGVKRIERLQKIAHQAAEQCHRTVIPTIESPLTINQLVAKGQEFDVCLFADEEEAKTGERPRLADRIKNLSPNEKVLIVFGPEGGLSRNEAEAFLEANFLPVALGPRILRTETAPLYFLSAVSYEFE
ncbi:16S rRNA (uracil(1498)-N(3))-methyltransferase [Sporosarcina ureilytica]|uniref:Ribosomal RNA small subunit methyltransferase E n=1 Tax=Sporosarcina ureilytica TaxID=298596 RepID=A0A1D8JGT3_9BACL|nr:16S rRNA (uracil(1498)-N(3))-methyltransferase [Sporosarcina ureilytica]AOV07908.1 16S rRNA (uracil(1498)-N(3))-methyltransferase [Sporosarcina ureilytica]